jgi:hypothetical protein
MNDVFGRSMFAPKTAAREKLRNMGGIVASSAPLMQAAKGYAPGGQSTHGMTRAAKGILLNLLKA